MCLYFCRPSVTSIGRKVLLSMALLQLLYIRLKTLPIMLFEHSFWSRWENCSLTACFSIVEFCLKFNNVSVILSSYIYIYQFSFVLLYLEILLSVRADALKFEVLVKNGQHESTNANEYMKDRIFELLRKITIYDWSSQLYTQLEQLWNKSQKKIQAWTGFESNLSTIMNWQAIRTSKCFRMRKLQNCLRIYKSVSPF